MADSNQLEAMPEVPVKRKPGRPFGSKKKVLIFPNKDPAVRPTLDMGIPKKRGRGRPPLNRPPCPKIEPVCNGGEYVTALAGEPQGGALTLQREAMEIESRAKGVLLPENAAGSQPRCSNYKNPTIGIQGLMKRGRGRPRKSISDEIEKIKARNLAEGGVMRNHMMLMTGGELKTMVTGRGRVPGHKNIVLASKRKAKGVALLVGRRQRGRPRKIQRLEGNNEQARFCNPNFWTAHAKFKQPQAASDFFGPYRAEYPTEVGLISENGMLQMTKVPQVVGSPGADPQCSSWESRDVMNEDGNSQEIQEHQYSSWEAKPEAAQWLQGAPEHPANSLGNRRMSQWVPMTSQQPPSDFAVNSTPEEPNYQDSLITELSDFKSQLLKELSATRAEMREGAQMVRSAIAGVSAEIRRLGQILQPLVSLVTASNWPQQDAPVARVPHVQQDTPPEDTLEIIQPSTLGRGSSHQGMGAASRSSTASDSLTRSVKLENVKNTSESSVDTPKTIQADHNVDLHHKSHTNVASSTTMDHHNDPKAGATSDSYTVAKVPSARSLLSSPEFLLGHASEENSH